MGGGVGLAWAGGGVIDADSWLDLLARFGLAWAVGWMIGLDHWLGLGGWLDQYRGSWAWLKASGWPCLLGFVE